MKYHFLKNKILGMSQYSLLLQLLYLITFTDKKEAANALLTVIKCFEY